MAWVCLIQHRVQLDVFNLVLDKVIYLDFDAIDHPKVSLWAGDSDFSSCAVYAPIEFGGAFELWASTELERKGDVSGEFTVE